MGYLTRSFQKDLHSRAFKSSTPEEDPTPMIELSNRSRRQGTLEASQWLLLTGSSALEYAIEAARSCAPGSFESNWNRPLIPQGSQKQKPRPKTWKVG